MVMEFDELNILNEENIDYESYFGEMDLTEEEKRKRVSLAEKFETLFIPFFLLFSEEKEETLVENKIEKYKELIKSGYVAIVISFLTTKENKIPSYVKEYAEKLSNDIVNTTIKNKGSEYYTSNKRAKFISANEANSIGNYAQQIEAIKSEKKYKTWKTMRDKYVRHTHQVIDEKKIGIFEPFQVGNSKMLYPRDSSQGASATEIVNCRCVVKYQ